jgi:hypothetical protein
LGFFASAPSVAVPFSPAGTLGAWFFSISAFSAVAKALYSLKFQLKFLLKSVEQYLLCFCLSGLYVLSSGSVSGLFELAVLVSGPHAETIAGRWSSQAQIDHIPLMTLCRKGL